ncbi:hypothetical protein VTN77DRAFT_741 [Rasamsonia byssochlamydoides]|uniref:uncharacterized protein n=1 Tax=Rasamsonia byssochlamydoides TaxID=89139 RepID=UPI003742F635
MLDSNSTLTVGEDVSLTLGAESLLIADESFVHKARCCGLIPKKSKASREIPFYNIISADLSETNISIKYARPISKHDVSVGTLEYAVDNELRSKAETWIERLLDRAYGDAQRNKTLKVLINPFGGKGHAVESYYHYAEPIFAAAGCTLDVETTQYCGHAADIAEQIDTDAYDAVVCCSGDGLPYEVFNGLARKPNAAEALSKIAVALLPGGSGNAMAWNLTGTGSVSLAALAIVKGIRTPLDLVSITQGDTRKLSFLSQSYGIIAESDLGTEHLRWMGSARFTYGFIVRLLGKTTYPCDLAFKVEMSDKQEIKNHYLAHKNKKPRVRDDDDRPSGLPPLKYGTVKDDVPKDWEIVSSDTIGTFYAGNMAIMSAGTNFFPASLPSDGLMDVVTIDGTLSLMKVSSIMKAVEKGTLFDMPEVTIRKVSAYRLTPRQDDGYISVDGESVPFEPFQVEVHQGLGTVLSKSGHLYETSGPV